MGQSWSMRKAIDRAEYEHLRLSKWAARSSSLDGRRGDRLGYRRKRMLAAALLARKLAWALTLSASRTSRRFRRRRTPGRGCGTIVAQPPAITSATDTRSNARGNAVLRVLSASQIADVSTVSPRAQSALTSAMLVILRRRAG